MSYGHIVISFSRLQLPGGQKYVEAYSDEYGIVDHYEESAFADIYPRRIGTVSRARSETRKGQDGNTYDVYYFTDNSLPFDPTDYMIGGKVIRVSFQEGSELAGQGDEDNGTFYFEVNFDSKTREFEIITIWPYDNDMRVSPILSDTFCMVLRLSASLISMSMRDGRLTLRVILVMRLSGRTSYALGTGLFPPTTTFFPPGAANGNS